MIDLKFTYTALYKKTINSLQAIALITAHIIVCQEVCLQCLIEFICEFALRKAGRKSIAIRRSTWS